MNLILKNNYILINRMNNNQRLGHLYELQIRDYIINNLNKMAYLWSHTPENILIENNIIGSHNEARLKRKENKLNPLIDTGIDIIQMEENGCSLVQCKNGYKKGLTMNDLAGFMCWIATLDKLNGYVYYTDKLSINIQSLPVNPRIHYIKHNYNNTINDIDEIDYKFKVDEYKLKYQMEAFEMAKEYYQENINGIISMPCGTGKTYVSYLIKKLFRQIIILSPLKQFAKQNLDRYIEYGYPYKTLLVDSDGCRDVEYIKEFINNNRRFVISATYDSIDVIYQCMEFMHKPFFIIDEFHNLSKNNVTNEDDIFYKVINTKHRKLFMSATPRVYEMEYENDIFHDVVFGSTIYNMSFTDAIKSNYITDYTIWLPSIHENTELLDKDLSVYEIDDVIKSKCKFLYSYLVNNGSRKCIIYCTDTNEITNMMLEIEKLDDYYCLDYHMDYITSNISHKKRDNILKTFAISTKIELLFSCRILDECIDIPSCDSIFITYPSQSKIRTIQRLCRCIRIDKNNKYKKGNVLIWCDEYSKILETLSGIKEYDIEFREKIKLNVNGHYGIVEDKGLTDDKKLISDYTMGIKEFRDISWDEKLDMVKKYINEHGDKPSRWSKDEGIKQLGTWVSHQMENYKNKTKIMKNNIYYNKFKIFFDEYKDYFLDSTTIWLNQLENVKKYMDEHKKKPSQHNENIVIRQLGCWLTRQSSIYNKKIEIMKNPTIYTIWTSFINDNKYNAYLLDNIIIWLNNLDKVKQYIDEFKEKPLKNDENNDIKQLGNWISSQIANYNKKSYIMKNEDIYIKWTNFINDTKYKEFFIDDTNIWLNKLENVKEYINKYKKLPLGKTNDININRLAHWIYDQNTNYRKKRYIMENNNIYNKWTNFIDNYKEYFLDNNTIWLNKLEDVKTYINKYKERPSKHNENECIKHLGSWISTQITNYKSKSCIMVNEDIYNKWTDFINDYKDYFLDNNIIWLNNLDKVKKYIDKYKKKPCKYHEENDIKQLCLWINTQKHKYKYKIQIMQEKYIYNAWTAFINDPLYKDYFD